MDIGRLNRRVTFQRKTATTDALNQPLEQWTDFATAWADVRFKTGLQSIVGELASAEQDGVECSVRIRYRSDITAAMRIVDGSAIYDIKQVLPNIGAKDYVDLVCTAGVSNG